MTTVQTVGAVSGAAAEWLAIDWHPSTVTFDDFKCVSAGVEGGRWNKVKACNIC